MKIFWGYGLYPNRKGNFVDKKMSQCNGEEILQELWHHLKIKELMVPLMDADKINGIPVAMPFTDSLFMPRSPGDRSDVLPKNTSNFAFLGQFAEVPKDCVFTVEYWSGVRKRLSMVCLRRVKKCCRSTILFTVPRC